MRDTTLLALMHSPFLSADDLALLCSIGERGARRALVARVAAGEAGDIVDPASRRRLYFLTAAGVTAAAQIIGKATSPEELASRYGLGEHALLCRLPALDRLVAGRANLLRLATALAGSGGALEDWRAFPVRWPFRRAGRKESLVLDGEAILRFADGVRCALGYLWDGDPGAPPEALAARLDRLAEVQACPDYALPYRVRVPAVLLVTTTATRVPAGYRPGLLWTTVEALARADPLGAEWRSAAGPGEPDEVRGLRAALDRLGLMPPRPTPAAAIVRVTALTAPHRPDVLRQRAARARITPFSEPTPEDFYALPLVLPPRAWPLLQCVGQHPLLNRHQLASVLENNSFDTWQVLRQLRRHGLCQAWRPRGCGHAWRYSLTTRGTALLAQATALTPLAYRLIYGVLDDARRSGEQGLSYARTNLEHTDGINAAYLAFLRAARARGGTLAWRGEWACTRSYVARDKHGREKHCTLRPDAELRYRGPDGAIHAFLEYDRSTASAAELADKVTQYYTYRRSAATGDVTVLLVTRGPGRADEPFARACDIAQEQHCPLLDLRTTTATDLFTSGPWAPIWRHVSSAPHALDDPLQRRDDHG